MVYSSGQTGKRPHVVHCAGPSFAPQGDSSSDGDAQSTGNTCVCHPEAGGSATNVRAFADLVACEWWINQPHPFLPS